ncbi:hypothetical protein G9A89_021250 [Geosiphon pyriformis]|nr:hypothetical protein G9A89_021250 [Geosiphon pyriformis]
MAKVIGVIMTSHDELDQLKFFLQNEPLNKITVARAFHELWKCKDVQTEESDCNCLLEVFKELTAETLNSDRKEYFTSLQDIDKNALVDVVARLMEASIYQMPIGLDIEVTKNDRQSDASKKRKNRQVSDSRGNKPDLMIRAIIYIF